MSVKQISVFIANKEGRIEKVTEVLRDACINITSLSLAESEDFGLLRLIVSDPDKAKAVLKDAGLSAKMTDVVAVEISNKEGSLHELLTSLKEFNIEYMYVLSSTDTARMIMRIHNIEEAENLLKNKGFKILGPDEVYR